MSSEAEPASAEPFQGKMRDPRGPQTHGVHSQARRDERGARSDALVERDSGGCGRWREQQELSDRRGTRRRPSTAELVGLRLGVSPSPIPRPRWSDCGPAKRCRCRSRGDYDKAEPLLRAALTEALEARDFGLAAEVSTQLVCVHADSGSFDAGLAHATTALGCVAAIKQRSAASRVYRCVGSLAHARGPQQRHPTRWRQPLRPPTAAENARPTSPRAAAISDAPVPRCPPQA